MNESPDKPRLKQQIFDFFPTLDRSERKELAGIFLTLAAAGPLRPGVKDDLVQVIRTARGDANAHVRIFTLLEASTTKP